MQDLWYHIDDVIKTSEKKDYLGLSKKVNECSESHLTQEIHLTLDCQQNIEPIWH